MQQLLSLAEIFLTKLSTEVDLQHANNHKIFNLTNLVSSANITRFADRDIAHSGYTHTILGAFFFFPIPYANHIFPKCICLLIIFTLPIEQKKAHTNTSYVLEIMMPKNGTELPTRGFSVTTSEFPNLLKLLQQIEIV